MADLGLVQEVRIVRFMKVHERSGQVDRQRQVDAITRSGWRLVAALTVGPAGEHCDVFFARDVPTRGVAAPLGEGEFQAPRTDASDVRSTKRTVV